MFAQMVWVSYGIGMGTPAYISYERMLTRRTKKVPVPNPLRNTLVEVENEKSLSRWVKVSYYHLSSALCPAKLCWKHQQCRSDLKS